MKRRSIVLKIFIATLILISGLLCIQLVFNQVFLTSYYEKAKISNLKKNIEILKSESSIDINDSEKLDKLKKSFVQFEEAHGVSLAFTNDIGIPLYGLEQTFANSELEIIDNTGLVHILPIDRYRNKTLIEGENFVIGKGINIELPSDSVTAGTTSALPSIPIDSYKFEEIENTISNKDDLLIKMIENDTINIANPTISDAKVKSVPVSGIITALNIEDITSASSSYREEIFYNYINSFIFSKVVPDKKMSLLSNEDSNITVIEASIPITSPDFLSIEKVKDGETSISNYMIATKVNTDNDDSYWLFASLPVQSLKDASNILNYYSLYLFIVLLFIGGLLAYIYAKNLAKPILSMNKIAKDMATLNFSNTCIVYSNDELGDLGKNLNHLSTTLKYTLDDLQEANAKLKIDIEKERTRDAEQKAFVATLSHELKTPLMIMRGTAEGIAAGIYEKEKLSSILAELSSMDHLIGEMLQFSKSESLKIETTTINLGTMLSNICKRLNPLRDDIEKKFLIKGDFTVNFDKNHLDKILSNIYHNALRYTPEGETIYVSIIRDESKHPHIRIENTGIFLSTDDLQKIWEPFYRVEDSRNRQTGGHGLGLYIVKRLVSVNNSNINVSNTTRGICFDIEFPVEN